MTVPLLHLAAGHEHASLALDAAARLTELDEAAGVAAAVELVPRSTEAAVWLLHRGEACLAAVERLWDTLERPDMATDWDIALAMLLPDHCGEPRFAAALAKVAAQAKDWIAEKAIWLLAEVAPGCVPAVILERLADAAGQARAAAEWLYALSRGRRPGRRLEGVADPSDPESRSLHIPFDDRRWSALGHTSTLAHEAELLIELSSELRIDLEATAATLLGGDATRWSELWRRASATAVLPEEIDEIRAIVDVIDSDRPGQILARLIWRLRLKMTALLERDEDLPLAASVASVAQSREQALHTLLSSLFDEFHLRRFLSFGEQGTEVLRSLPGGHSSFAVLVDGALAELIRRGLVASLWHRLRSEFPARAGDIERIAALWSDPGV